MANTVVVIPCFNEAARLDPAPFLTALDRHPDFQFLFVDDGSSDGTDRILDGLAARHPSRLRWLKLPHNHGKAEAVRQGVLQALASTPAFVGYLDADLSTPIEELEPLKAAFRDPQVLAVMASRVAMLGRDIQRSPWRHYTGRIFATGASLVLGLRVYDTQCGAKLFRNAEPIRKVFERPFLSAWAFDVEILARLLRFADAGQIPPVDRAVVEVPLTRWTHVRGSKIGLVDSVVATAQLLAIWWRYRR